MASVPCFFQIRSSCGWTPQGRWLALWGFNLNWSKNGTWRFHMVFINLNIFSKNVEMSYNVLLTLHHFSSESVWEWSPWSRETTYPPGPLITQQEYTKYIQVFSPTLRWSHFFVSPLTSIDPPWSTTCPIQIWRIVFQWENRNRFWCWSLQHQDLFISHVSMVFPWFFYILYILYIWMQKGVRQLVVVIGLQVKIN